ncbi:29R [Xanthomonas phage Xp10]|uniref:29R n=1 Tax=Xanthomonas phage Xp10 TaxID=2907956 RepID=Q7Y5I8_9CAUD|nr:Rz-like spanin [Xanthomonas phage Xp10]AAP58696.1 29R [Xanthomonas phage Xp10]
MVGLALLMTVAVLAVQVTMARKHAAKVQEQVYAVTADLTAERIHSREVENINKQQEKKNADVSTALEANKEWADDVLPDDVAAQLQLPDGSTRAVPPSL